MKKPQKRGSALSGVGRPMPPVTAPTAGHDNRLLTPVRPPGLPAQRTDYRKGREKRGG